MSLIEGRTGSWEAVIGMEVHAQVVSESKLFSGASTGFGGEPNAQVSLVDAAMPGMLPVINEYCVEQAVRTGLGLGAEINLVSVFDRKNYFYPDLPQGYQISQYSQPIVGRGTVEIGLEDGSLRTVRIARLHLEQDAGKSLHDRDPRKTWVDLNRAGVALMEIVTEPDMRSPEEAAAFMSKLRSILRYLGTCDGNMQEGSLRADVNVSVRRPGGDLGTRCEIKNLNSIRFIRQAAEHEARRQIEVLEDGGSIDQETRLFDTDRGVTRSMRTKEEEHDYRYFPDPDLMPLVLTQDYVDQIKANLPELPEEKKDRYVIQLGLSDEDASILVVDPERAELFETAAEGRDPKLVANTVIHDVLGEFNKSGLTIRESLLTGPKLGGLIDLVEAGTISRRSAKDILPELIETGEEAQPVVDRRGVSQVSDTGAIEAIVDGILAERPDMVAEYRSGKTKLLGFFVGQAMKASQGKANPKTVNEILRARLDG